jgi:hypothetical protein
MIDSRRIATCLIGLIVATSTTQMGLAIDSTRPDYGVERAVRAKSLAQPFGWFSFTALQRLKSGMTTVGSAPDNSVVLEDALAHLATFEEKDGQVTFRAHDLSLTLHNATLSTAISTQLWEPGKMTTPRL